MPCLPPATDELEQLRRTVTAQRRTIDVLMEQVAKKQSDGETTVERIRQNRVLEEIVQRKTNELQVEREKLRARNDDMRLVLDHVVEGFLTVDDSGTVSRERSAAADRWLGVPGADTKLWHWIGTFDALAGAKIELLWDLLVDEILPREVALAQLPAMFRNGALELAATYRPIEAPGEKLRLLVVLVDVTVERQKSAAEERQKDLLHALEHVIRDRRGFFEFLDELDRLVEVFDHQASTDRKASQLALHTIKGNCAIFGLASIARTCDDAEAAGVDDPIARARVVDACRVVGDMFRELCPERARDRLDHSRESIADLELAVLDGSPRGDLLNLVRALHMERLDHRFARLADTARATASRLGKTVEVVVDDGDVLVDARTWSPLLATLTHLVRNAVDHGLEPPSVRVDVGKPADGRLAIACRIAAGNLILTVTDDGGGVDWDAVAASARASGRPASTREDLVDALFHHGLSTRVDVTDISGRGVGLSAVALEVRSHGGTIRVDSCAAGTTFELRLPAVDCAVERAWSTPRPARPKTQPLRPKEQPGAMPSTFEPRRALR